MPQNVSHPKNTLNVSVHQLSTNIFRDIQLGGSPGITNESRVLSTET